MNEIKLDDDGITPMEKFPGTTPDITLKNHHTWGFPLYVVDEILQGKKSILPKWEPQSCAGFYIGKSPFHAG